MQFVLDHFDCIISSACTLFLSTGDIDIVHIVIL